MYNLKLKNKINEIKPNERVILDQILLKPIKQKKKTR